MRSKLIVPIALGALIAVAMAAAAQGAPVTVALYSFQSGGDVKAFQKVSGARCKRKWREREAMAVIVGRGTNSCGFRTSVVGDSSDSTPDQALAATVSLGGKPAAKVRKKGYAGVAVHHSETAGYELRVLPYARKWQLLRDPKGKAGPTVIGVGKGKVVRPRGKPNGIEVRAFDYGGSTVHVRAFVNGKAVAGVTDSAPDKPDGRRTVVTTGRKGTGPGTGLAGIFDSVAVKVPNPF